MKRWKKEERGMVIVEATIVFPVMFFILFFLIYLGNAYYLKAKVDNCVTQYALKGAAQYADPMMTLAGTKKEVPKKMIDAKLYRYLFSNASGMETSIESDIKKEIRKDCGFFSGMTPTKVTCDAKMHNYVLYHTFSVEADYVIEFPIRFIGSDEVELLRLSSFAEVPITDAPEFIRNTDMVIDYLEQNETAQKAMDQLRKAVEKMKSFVKGK